ncbi:MAG: alpha/beta hydrolase [Acidimicrobiia bacterium]
MTDGDLGAPFFRESGVGPGVVCLHSNASTSGQWRPLMERFSPKIRVIAVDTLGAGKSPDWPADRVVTLSDEAAFLEPAFARAGDPFAIVGHSYGGAVALIAALANQGRVSRMVVYEPTLFSLLKEESPGQETLSEIRDVACAAAADVEMRHTHRAAERFIDYWMGVGSWAATPELLKEPIAASMVNVGGWAEALIGDSTPLESFRKLDIPVLYLVGEHSPNSSKGVARLLTAVLPEVEVFELKGLGHMAPITHPDTINELITGFLNG